MNASDYEISETKAIVPDMRDENDGQDRHAVLVKGPNGIVTILAPTEEEAQAFACAPDLMEACEAAVGFCVNARQTWPDWQDHPDVGLLYAKTSSVVAEAKPK